MDNRFCYLLGASLLSAIMLSWAHAASTSTSPANAPPPGSLAPVRPIGVSTVAAPPANFNPLTASSAARAQYAIPPPPDSKVAPRAYNEWVRAVTGPHNYVAPVLTQTNIAHGPRKKVGPSVPQANANNVIATNSSNWSGTSIVNSQNPFTVEAVSSVFVVPTAHQAFGLCTGDWDYAALWPGIDGDGSNDVLQGGIEVDAYCKGGTTVGFYSAWIEWFPLNETRVSSPVIHPGDMVYVQVWNSSPTTASVYFYNYSTLETASYLLTAPTGTTLVGNSVEWIVERPEVDGNLASLTNYIDTAWPSGYAWNYTAAHQTVYYDAQNPSTGTLNLITMLDNNSQAISTVAVVNSGFLWYQDVGSAY